MVMQPVKMYSPTVFRVAIGLGAMVLLGLLAVAWLSGSPEVGLSLSLKLRLSAAAVLLGGGLIGWGMRYRAQAEAEERLREVVRQNMRG